MANDTPFFSIVVPVYNTEKYLEELIQSVHSQTFNDWELILVDDGSTDGSGNICDSNSDGLSVFTYHTPNRGGLMARHYGVKKSKGKYVVMIDSDDRMVPECLQVVKETIDQTDCDMLTYGFRTFGDNSCEFVPPFPCGMKIGTEAAIEAITGNEWYALWNKVIIGNIARKSDICDLGRLSMNDDVAMMIPLLPQIKSVYALDQILYEYRVYNTSGSHYLTAKGIIDAGKAIDYAEQALEAANLETGTTEKNFLRTYAKMFFALFDLVEIGRNQFSDFEPVRQQRIYCKLCEQATAKEYGLERIFLLRLFQQRHKRVLELVMSIKRAKIRHGK